MSTKRSLIAAATLLLPTATFAQPVVTGNVISWPDNGWYQVQSATSFESLCEGVPSCTVDTGNYIVINHTTGERFDASVTAASPTSLTVDENTISWPNDGWYQVQAATDYASICNGGSSCTVPAGNYIVINHTKGTRTNINVGNALPDESAQELPASVTYDLPADVGTTPGPTNISIAAFSDQVGELTWDVIQTEFNKPITEIEIWRDGVQVDTLSGWGVASYLDWNRTLGQPYTYHIVAIDNEGRKTVKFVDSNGGIANPYRPVITTEALPTELEQNLKDTFELINGTVAQKIGAVVHRIFEATPSELGLTLIEEVGNYEHYNCPAGGTVYFYEERGFKQFYPSACAIGSIVIDDGRAFQRLYVQHDADQGIIGQELVGTTLPRLSIDGGVFTLSDDGKSSSFNTGVFTISDGRDMSLITSTDFGATYENELQNLTKFNHSGLMVNGRDIGDVAVSAIATEAAVSESTTYGIRVNTNESKGTFGQRVRARTHRLFALPDQAGRPSIGSMAFYSLDIGNETYGIDADNGNPETFTLNLTKSTALTSYDVSWSEDYSLELLSLKGFDVGF